MAQSKRPASTLDSDAALGQNWKKRKQERAHNARFIQAQALKSSSSSSNNSNPAPAPGSGFHANSTKNDTPTGAAAPSVLPTSIEVEAIVSTRAFQVQSFLRSIKSAKLATTTRAWQLLPRHARRRAASHNLLRLPSRLRGKAFAELKSSTTQARTRSETRRRMPDHGVVRATLRRQKLAHRASHPKRRWLETHLWHAKRFRMTTEKGKGKELDQGTEYGRWGFVLPETTMMKSHKASWKSALEYVTVHDSSYLSVFRIGVCKCSSASASFDDEDETLHSELLFLLRRSHFGPPSLFSTSSRTRLVYNTVLRHENVKATALDGSDSAAGSALFAAALAPVKIVLLPQASLFRQPHAGDGNRFICREALVFVHPAGQIYVRRALKEAGCILTDEEKNTLSKSRPQKYACQLETAPDPWLAAGGKDRTTSRLEKKRLRQAFAAGSAKELNETEKANLTGHTLSQTTVMNETMEQRRAQGYNIFEITGPKAPALLKAVLKFDEQSNSEATRITFQDLLASFTVEGSESCSAKQANMVALEVHDPRLPYPPRLKPIKASPAATETDCDGVHTNSRLLSLGASGPTFSKGEIDSRRAKNLVPGSRLTPDARDDIVPVVLLKQSLVNKPTVGSFTLIVPRGWGMPFFLSLIATHHSGASSGARVIGQHQLRHQKLELSSLAESQSGTGTMQGEILSYPFNWPGTLAFAQMEKAAASNRYEVWSKRPKGKRTEYKWPTQSDWKLFVNHNVQTHMQKSLSEDRTGSARPFPFGGEGTFHWIAKNSQVLFGASGDELLAEIPWLVTVPKLDIEAILSIEVSLAASAMASALVPLRLQAVRKGTVSPQSSLILAKTYADQVCWVHHLDSTQHPSLVANRASSSKMDKKHLKDLVERRLEIMQLGKSAPEIARGALDTQLATRRKHVTADIWSQYIETAADPELLHSSSADWNSTVGLVLDGEYSLGSGSGYGIGAITLRAWKEVLVRQSRLDAEQKCCAGRKPRNLTTTKHLLLMREPGTDVVRAVTASAIPL